MTWFIILAVITGGLAFGLPPNPQTLHQLHTSSLGYRIAVLILLVPYGVLWYAAFYAFAKLKDYACTIKGSKDGEAFRNIMIGVGILAFGLILPPAILHILQTISIDHPQFKHTADVVNNYLNILVTLASFIYISNGTHLLTKLGKNRPGLRSLRVFVLLFVMLTALFTYLVMSYHLKHNVYYLNTWLLILTLIIPSLFAWFTALMGAYEFELYATYVKGLLYRKALRQLSYGIVVAILCLVATQFLDNTLAVKINSSIVVVSIVEYVLLIMYATGLILMARGAGKLKAIEEV